MSRIKSGLAQHRLGSVLISLLGCALLLGAAAWAQEVQIITRAGQKQMLARPGTPPGGARDPDVTLVAEDPKIAIVYKDWPILGPVSQYAAASALAAGWQGKYLAAHDALISGPRLAQDQQVDSILQTAGVNMDTLKKDRTEHAKEIAALLERNDQEAHALTLDGTPGLVVGRQLVPGVADVSYLKKLIASSRQGK
jgi:hypothetical protein